MVDDFKERASSRHDWTHLKHRDRLYIQNLYKFKSDKIPGQRREVGTDSQP